MPTWTLRVVDRFEAAHALRSYQGAPEPTHGHSWRVEAIFETAELGEEGMAYDFVAIKRALAEAVAPFHHADVNTVPPFDVETPTTEHMARHLHDELARRLPGAPLAAVTLWEGPDCSATYRP